MLFILSAADFNSQVKLSSSKARCGIERTSDRKSSLNQVLTSLTFFTDTESQIVSKFVKLACVKHIASVPSAPGSNCGYLARKLKRVSATAFALARP
jgi:hypothetical protein